MAKFLIVRFSSIGDIVLTSPVIRCLKEQVADAEVHYLTKEDYYPLLYKNPHLTEIHCLKKDNFSALLDELKTYNFDYIIDLHRNLRTEIVKRTLKVKSYSFRKLNFRKWVKVYTKLNILPKVHIVDRYLQTLNAFNVMNDEKGLDYYLPKGSQIDERDFPEKFLDNFMVIAVGSGHYTKTILPEKLKEICDKTLFPVVFVGDTHDRYVVKEIIDESKGVFVNVCGQYNINQAARLVKRSKLVIAADTGIMHIAAALKKPVISVWGNTVTDFGMYPYMPGKHSYIIEVDNLWCRPCSKIGFDNCPLGHFKCMKNIPVDKIIAISNLIFKESDSIPLINK